MLQEAHAWLEDGGKLREAVEHKGNDGEAHIGAQHSKGCNAGEVAKELLLLDGQPSIEDDGRQQIPVTPPHPLTTAD